VLSTNKNKQNKIKQNKNKIKTKIKPSLQKQENKKVIY